MIVVVGGVKGGTGKSSLLSHLATLAALESRVLVVDADWQASMSCWADARNAISNTKGNPITTISMRGANIGSEIQRIAANYDYVFIDTDGQDGGTQRASLLVADLFITLFAPRPQDIWTADKVGAIVLAARNINTNLCAVALLNKCDGREAKQIAEAREALAEFSDAFQLLPFEVGDRKDIGNSFSDGLGICEMKVRNKKAMNEICQLWSFVKSKKEG